MVQTCQQVDGSPAAPMVWVHRYKKQVFLFLVVSLSFAYVFICRSRRLDVNTVFDASSQFSYGNMWLKNLSADACSCGEFTICYGSKANTTHARSLTGAAFPCRNDDFFYWAQPEKKATFAVAADSEFLSQLLVLIGSIHKYYKEHPILVYDIGNIAEQKKHLRGILTNIRNVKVVVADDLIPLERSEYANGAFQPFLMIDSLRRFEEVYWMSPLHEIVSDQIMDYPSDTKFTTYIRIGSERLQPHKKLDFAKYFPFSTLNAHNCSFRYLQDSIQTRNALFWLVQCAQTVDCWQCKTADEEALDCLPFLESRLAEDFDMPIVRDLRCTTLDQKWSSPECGWRCALSSLAAIFTFVLLTASLLFVISARFVAD